MHRWSEKTFGGTLHKDHEEHIAGKGINSLNHYNLVHKFVFMPRRKPQWTNDGGNSRKYRHGSWRKSETRKRWSMKQVKKAKQCTSRHWWTCVISKMRSYNQNFENTKAELYSEVTLWKTTQVRMQCLLSKARLRPRWRPQKSWTLYPDYQDAQDKRRCKCIYAGDRMFRTAADAVSAYTRVRMEDAPSLLEIPKSECPAIRIRPPKHKWPKSWSSMEDPVVLLDRNLYGHPLAGLRWERQFEKVLLKCG